ncbi:MAG: YkgJ family cysteine cluster protein [Humidesulfovibrio sp.]
MSDTSQDFLNGHQELKTGERFRFACHPGVSCFGACCSALDLMLTPYDALRLRHTTGQTSREFIQLFASLLAMPEVGLPMLHMRMLPDARHKCPFQRDTGCAVYQDRPSACRTYPLGRATQRGPDGAVVERIFMAREAHCHGFEAGTDFDAGAWMHDQGLEPYNEANDRYMALAEDLRHFAEQTGRHMAQKQLGMAGLALYQPDEFQPFLTQSGLMDRLEMTEARKNDVLHDEEACLDFGYDWLELSLLGHTEHLRPKGPRG